ncbi:MAG: phosphate/phosphite/phosphonate ABC transporter substrate-binding protein, partial [Myxococcota bacterium]
MRWFGLTMALMALPVHASAKDLVVTTLPFQDQAAQDAVFQILSDELTRALGERVRFEAGRSYQEVIEKLTTRRTDVAFLGGLAYLEARRRGNARAILRTVRGGRGGYRGVLIVARGSTVEAVDGLRKVDSIGFVDRYSTTGYAFPARLLSEAGVELRQRGRFLGSHQAVIQAVTERKIGAGAVFEAALEMLDDPGAVRVLAETEVVPGDPIVVRPGLGRKRVQALRSALMELATRPDARAFFEFAGIDSLVPVTDSDNDQY